MVWEISMGVYPRLEFYNIMFINCLGYDLYTLLKIVKGTAENFP